MKILFHVVLATLLAPLAVTAESPTTARAGIPLDQIGAEAQKQISGRDAPNIVPINDGAKLKATMQDLEGEATAAGLWLSSIADDDQGRPNRFRVMATALSRQPNANAVSLALDMRGQVRCSAESALWIRPGLVEQYTVSTDGVRQDFIIPERPLKAGGALAVELVLTGAIAKAASYGATLTVTATGRELAYSRLKVIDATGREIAAEMQVPAPDRLRVVVQDTDAVYPLCIDPTFGDADWVSIGGFPGANDGVEAIAADGAGNLYIGGLFTAVGTVAANYIAKWNGSAWSSLGSGMNYDVRALAVSGSDVYAGGGFTTAGGVSVNHIAKWNGTAWSALDSGTNSDVAALTVSDGDLYAGGNFTMAGGTPANRIAKWNGTSWSALGSGISSEGYPWVYSLVVSGGDVYAGGTFDTAGGVPVSSIARWNGSEWSDIGSGIYHPYGTVSALAAIGTKVYAAGSNGVRQWDGISWQSIGNSGLSTVYSLAVSGSTLYVGGSSPGGQYPVASIATWNGTAWSTLGAGTGDGKVNAIAVSGSDIFIGGSFTSIGGTTANFIARWNGGAWSALNSGLSRARVYALAMMNGELYVGGDFIAAGNDGDASFIARWNGSSWSALGAGTDAPVYALAVSGSDLYVGGQFTTAGGAAASHVAKWNGSTWSALGAGVDSQNIAAYTYVYALAVSGSDLYAGGNFTTAGGSSIPYMARWNGSAWSAVGSGTSPVNAPVYALEMDGTDLYVGGGGGTGYVLKWNGSAWSSIGPRMSGVVRALALGNGTLYAGGDFYGANDSSFTALRVAKWSGSAWSALGSGMGDSVYSLAASGDMVYAGGRFRTAGGALVNGIAVWNNGVWSAVGSGVLAGINTASVHALLTNGSQLYVGGYFLTAGNGTADNLAMTTIHTYNDPILAVGIASGVGATTATLSGTVNPNGNAITAQFEYGPSTSYGSTAAVTLSPADGTTPQNVSANVTGLASHTTYHYRLTVASIDGLGTLSSEDGTFTTLVSLQDWRQQYFGTTSNTGNAADSADADGDGLPNLLEWACLQDPTKISDQRAFIFMDIVGGSIQFVYMRSKLAVQMGAVFTVESSDTLAAGSWSSSEVMTNVLADDGTQQLVGTITPQGASGRRFVRLSVAPPP